MNYTLTEQKANGDKCDAFLDAFNKLPDKAKSACFKYVLNIRGIDGGCVEKTNDAMDRVILISNKCQSPIEMIFASYFLKEVGNIMLSSGFKEAMLLFDVLLMQPEIKVNGKKYYADFMFDTDQFDRLSKHGVHSDKHFKLIIECDGHDFHTSKKQVRNDNERDFAMKTVGYDILRFSGSQIFNDPKRCITEALLYILKNSDITVDIKQFVNTNMW